MTRPLVRLLAADLKQAIDNALSSNLIVVHGGKDMADQPNNPTTWPGPTAPQAHPATGVPEQNPRPIGPATGKPQTEQTPGGTDA